MVATDEAVAGLVPNETVMPASAEALRATPPLKPLEGVTVTVEVPEVPAVTVADGALNEKPAIGYPRVPALNTSENA